MDERKKYSVEGTVTISTEEYRDLIEGKMEAEKELEEYRRNFWREQEKTRELQKKVEAQEKAIEHYRKFVDADAERNSAYKLFLVHISEEV